MLNQGKCYFSFSYKKAMEANVTAVSKFAIIRGHTLDYLAEYRYTGDLVGADLRTFTLGGKLFSDG